MSDGIEIPISVEGAPKAAADIRAVNAALAGTEQQLKTTGAASAETGGRMRTAFANFSSGAGMQAAQQVMGNLVAETSELTRGLTGASAAAGRIGQSLVATLPSFGPIGIALAALAGGVSMVTRVEREQIEALRNTNRLYDQQARLGPMYTNIASTIESTATAQERLNRTMESARALLASEASMMTAGTSRDRIVDLERAADALLPSIRQMNGGLQANVQVQDVLAAITARNTGQLRQWGLNIQFGTDAAHGHTAALVALREAGERNARSTLASARAEAEAARRADLIATVSRRFATEDTPQMIAARARLGRATLALAAAERGLGAATGAAARAAREHAAALALENAAAEEAKQKIERQAVSDARRAAAAGAHTAAEIAALRTSIGLMLEQGRLIGVRSARTREAITAMQELESVETRLDALCSRPRSFDNETRYLALLTRQVELRRQVFEAEGRIRAAEETARTADATRQREAVDGLLEAERARIAMAQVTRNEVKAAEATRAEAARTAIATARTEAEAIRNGPVELLKTSAESLNQAVSSALFAAIQNGENVGEAIRKALEASLFSLATQSTVKALYETAQGFGSLALGSPTAALHFKAAGLYAATAAGAAVAGVGVRALGAGAGASGGAAAGVGGTPPSRGLGTGPGAAGGGSLAPVTINYNAPVIGGRDAASWETGARMGRYLSAADARVRRAPALMGG